MSEVLIYATKICPCEQPENFYYLLPFLTEEKKTRILNFRFKIDKLRSLKGELLIRNIINELLKTDYQDIDIQTDINGKPYLNNTNDFHFNISHSGQWVVCATSNKPVGIDVEYKDDIKISNLQRFFSPEEIKTFNNIDPKYKIDHFFELWTLKESFIKAVGKGIQIPLDSFSITINEETINLDYKPDNNYYFKQYSIDQAYKLAVCSKNKFFNKHIIKKTCKQRTI